jgi:hypothetical protein
MRLTAEYMEVILNINFDENPQKLHSERLCDICTQDFTQKCKIFKKDKNNYF